MDELKTCVCGKCGETKEPVAFVDGVAYCEECFIKALEGDNG